MASYFLIAGEASGDAHAAHLIEAIKRLEPTSTFAGLGGAKMQAAGCRLYQDYSKMAYMGFIEVIKHLGDVKRNFAIAKQGLLECQPKVLILIDYPSFNLKMAKWCRAHLPNTKIVYYIPPKVWAWKTYRIHDIARLCDRVLGIFPFEPAFWQRYGYTCDYVGNPTVDTIRAWSGQGAERMRKAQRENIIAILPGSRRNEIKHCLPVMLQAARAISGEYRICVAAAPNIEEAYYRVHMQEGETLTRDTYHVLSRAQAAVVNSGTATLETAMIGCPQVAVYYVAMSPIADWIKDHLFKIKFFTLVNIIAGKQVILELLSGLFTAENIQTELARLLEDKSYREQMITNYESIAQVLGDGASYCSAEDSAACVIRDL